MRYYLMHVKKRFDTFNKNCIYWVNHENVLRVPSGYTHLYDVNVFEKYDSHQHMLLVRSGGIGDIIALSSLTGYAEKTTILTQNKYKPLAKYFEHNVFFKGFQEPLFQVHDHFTIKNYISKTGMMYGDTDIDNGSRDNWYEILSKSVGFEFHPEYGRPSLISLTNEVKDVCIVVSQSSSVNRTASKSELDKLALKYFKNVIHADEQGWTFSEYLHELDKARYVISVDTSAIHFREGIGKPALGLYGAFTTDSRTKYYKFTKSVNVKSSCEIQPCFYHDNQRCPKVTDNFAPCLSNNINDEKQNPDIARILSEAL
jgi:hypothetical protein